MWTYKPSEDSDRPAYSRNQHNLSWNQNRSWTAKEDAKFLNADNKDSDVSLCWAHMLESTFYHVSAHKIVLLSFPFYKTLILCTIFSACQMKISITKTCLYNFDPLKPHFYIIKLGFTGVFIIFLIFARKHRLWVLVRTASPRRF